MYTKRFFRRFILVHFEKIGNPILEKQPILILNQIIKFERRTIFRKIPHFWHIFNEFVRDVDWFYGKICSEKKKRLSYKKTRKYLKLPGFFNKIDSASLGRESLISTCNSLFCLKERVRINSFFHNIHSSAEMKILSFPTFQLTSPFWKTTFHDDQMNSLINSLLGTKLWIFSFESSWIIEFTQGSKRVDIYKLLKKRFRWTLVLPNTTLSVPKFQSHFVLTVEKSYIGTAMYYETYKDGITLYMNLLEKKLEIEKNIEFQLAYKYMRQTFQQHRKKRFINFIDPNIGELFCK